MKRIFIKDKIKFFSILILLTSCKVNSDKKQENKDSMISTSTIESKKTDISIVFTNDQLKISDIQIGKIESRNLSSIIKLTGLVEAAPENIATISAPLGGYIKTYGLLPGQKIYKGQILATLENQEFISIQQQFLENLGRLEYLEEEFKRQQHLRNEDINAIKTFQQITSELKVLKAKISGLEQQMALIGISSSNLKKTNNISRSANIYAPISGYIKTSNVKIGKYVTPTDELFEITGRNDLHLALNVFEKDLTKVSLGQSVKFSLANENKYDRDAKVFLIGQSADENKMIPVHCHLTKATGLIPGMYIKALLETESKKQKTVPSNAIVQLKGSDYIIVLIKEEKTNYTFHLIPVAKGVEQAGFSAIDLPSNVNANNLKVVIKNAYTILSAIKNAEEEE